MSITAVSVYDYGGGFRLGAEQAGVVTLAKRELDDPFSRTSAKQVALNFPDTPDIKAAPFEDWGRLPKVELAYGNPPCAAFSNKGYGHGSESHYMDQWRQFAATAARIKPKYTVMETVEMAVRRADGLKMLREVRDTVDPKATLHHVIVNAHDVGSAQIRRRYFAVITRRPFRPAWPAKQPNVVVKDVIGPRKVPKDNLLTLDKGGHNKIYWPHWREHGIADLVEAGSLDAQYPLLYEAFVDNGGDPRHFERPFIVRQIQSGVRKVSSGYNARRLAWDGPSSVVLSDSPRLLIHPAELRGISLREAYMLMGFPATWKLANMDGREGLAKQASNGVTVEAGRFVLEGITNEQPHANVQLNKETNEVWWWSPYRKEAPVVWA